MDDTKFRAHTDESVRALFDRLSTLKATSTKQQFKERQQQAGWNLNKTGLLLSGLDVKPVTSIMFDWMHVYVASGIFNREVGLLLTALQSVGISQAELHSCKPSLGPRGLLAKRSLVRLSSKKQEGDLKCSASECLSVYPVFRAVFVRLLHNGRMAGLEETQSFMLLCKVLDLL